MFIFSNVIHKLYSKKAWFKNILNATRFLKNNVKNFSIAETILAAFSKVSHNMFFHMPFSSMWIAWTKI